MGRLSHEERRLRRQRLAEAAQQGLYLQQIMALFDVSATTVKTACRVAGVPLNKSGLSVEEQCFRFLRLIQNGASPEAAAATLGINEYMQGRIVSAAKVAGFIKGSQDAANTLSTGD